MCQLETLPWLTILLRVYGEKSEEAVIPLLFVMVGFYDSFLKHPILTWTRVFDRVSRVLLLQKFQS